MKPKTKLQHQVVELSNQLPRITHTQEKWAYKHCFDHNATILKSGIISCLDCGHQWVDDQTALLTSIDGCICPSCNTKLQVNSTRKQKFDGAAYFSIITTFKGFQVIRHCRVDATYRVGSSARYNLREITELWIQADGKYEIISYAHQLGWYRESWTGDFAIRPKRLIANYDIMPFKIYPKKQLLPELARNGFKGDFHECTPFSIFQLLLSDSKMETLLKAEQYSVLKFFKSRKSEITTFWPSLKICIRNKYIINDASLWLDYIKFLCYFKKDIHNAKYTCPPDLRIAHDYWMNKQKLAKEKQRAEEKQKQLIEDEAEFKILKTKFFGLKFIEQDLQVQTLDSVLDHLAEAKAMHHCVDCYALRPDSLVFSATINGKRIETVEVSLKTFLVVQSRGLCNDITEHHNKIIELVNKNKKQIKNRLKNKKIPTILDARLDYVTI